MLKKIKDIFHNIRKSDNPFCKSIVRGKDIVWKCFTDFNQSLVATHNKKMINKEPLLEEGDMRSNLGLCLWGYLVFRSLLDKQTQKIKIPDNIKQIKIDVGLSFAAPNAALWLEKLQDRIVFGFEPNPENIQELLSGSNKKRGGSYHYLNLKYLNKRFFLFGVAIDSDTPCMKKFYMTDKDPGTSSFYKPNCFKIKKVIQVPTIRLSDFLSFIPWERFKYIEHIKVDAQGNDIRILRSAGSYLPNNIVFVTAECSTKNQYEYGQTEQELDQFMIQSGFQFIQGTDNGGNKTYVNSRFKHLMDKLDYSTEGL